MQNNELRNRKNKRTITQTSIQEKNSTLIPHQKLEGCIFPTDILLLIANHTDYETKQKLFH
jgi:hypothetical protein